MIDVNAHNILNGQDEEIVFEDTDPTTQNGTESSHSIDYDEDGDEERIKTVTFAKVGEDDSLVERRQEEKEQQSSY